MLDAFARVVEKLPKRPPQLTLISNLSGDVAANEQLTSADYWRRHAREPQRWI